jgi:hypothetical protein
MTRLHDHAEGERRAADGSGGVSIVRGFDPFEQAFHHITNRNPACSASTSPALAGRGRGVISSRIPSSPFITLSHFRFMEDNDAR